MTCDCKRFFDVTVSITLLLVSLPLLLLIALAVRVRLGSPILFRQARPGRGCQLFTMYKFRTMTEACDEQGNPLPDSQRMTALGRFLRALSLDELPQLINVIKGEMSLVGPRPLVAEHLPYYTDRELARFLVRPGITGWAQVHGRNYLPWTTRFELDVWYVENQSFWLDMKILLLTVKQVLLQEGVALDKEGIEVSIEAERSPMLAANNETRVMGVSDGVTDQPVSLMVNDRRH